MGLHSCLEKLFLYSYKPSLQLMSMNQRQTTEYQIVEIKMIGCSFYLIFITKKHSIDGDSNEYKSSEL